mmetsp:Transcript_21377/g.19448  ORF Transcript_21377/g.19448 Transcript_21377/m.19448 type:complete len:140 (-) Transcript_21377:24-443(-)
MASLIQFNIYIYFNGNANEAIDYYSEIFNGKVLIRKTFGESPIPCEEDMKNKIIHAMLQIENTVLMISDTPKDRVFNAGNNVVISVALLDVERANNIYNALSNEGSIQVPFNKQFWGSHFGELTDKFGVKWMINVEGSN